MRNLEQYDISLEEFDSLDGTHVFSKKYNDNKKKLLREYRKNIWKDRQKTTAKIAAACVVILVVAPVAVNAATNGELFSRIWGTAGHKNVPAHDEVIDDGKGGKLDVTYPERTFENTDTKKAEELIGKAVSYPDITTSVDGTTITIVSAVRDKNAAVVEFTMEKEGGVDVLNYGEKENELKGAWIAEDKSTFRFDVLPGGNIYVDVANSTDEKLYCYDYMTLDEEKNIKLKIDKFPCKLSEYYKLDINDQKRDEIESKVETSTITIPCRGEVESVTYENQDGGKVEISPLSMSIDMKSGLGLDEIQSKDPLYCYYVCINYKDGTKYVVDEHNVNGCHSCDVDIDNTEYLCETIDGKNKLVFNRLVDINNIESIIVNETTYMLSK